MRLMTFDDNMLYFLATNTTSGIDTNIKQYWRWHTYDTYTGVSFGVNSSLVGNTIVVPSFSSTQGVLLPLIGMILNSRLGQ
jgi:hypothetical protein